MDLLKKLKNCSNPVKVAIAFAGTMLLSAWLLQGHEQASTLLIVHIGLYMLVVNLTGENPASKKVCRKDSETTAH